VTAEEARAAAGGGEPQEQPTPFQALCGMLAAQVHMALGYLPDPVDGKIHVELAAARQGIELLAMLEEKTKGNLEARETKTLGALLANLRLTFVERVKELQSARTAGGEDAEGESSERAKDEATGDASEATDDTKADDGPTIVTP